MPLVLNGTTGVQDNSGAFVAGTSVASTSGTSIDFTSIPSWVKRITVMLSGVSLSGSSPLMIQIGDSGGIENTGYAAHAGVIQGGATNSADFTTGFGFSQDSGAGDLVSGLYICSNLTGNTWSLSGSMRQASNRMAMAAGAKTLSDKLDRIRITASNGTDTFDAGTINILWE